MKKFLLVLTVLATAFGLAACKEEAKAPVISNAGNVAAHVKGTAFDPLAGVLASDAKDGDLTESIIVEGEVDVNTNGTYTITYTVTNSAGIETKVTRTITVYTPNAAPVIDGVTSHVVALNAEFDPLDGVTAEDDEDGDLTADIVVTGSVDTSKVGKYQITYEVEDSDGEKGFGLSNILVVQDIEALYEGVLNLKFATADTKHTFFAAAERYLLDNMVGGIPFYVANSFSLLAERVTLPVETYIPSYGWGFRYADITKDDSQVKNVEGQLGQAGKYTYRTWHTDTFSTLNFWTYDDSISNDYLSLMTGGFYRQVLNDAKNGWEFAPDLASGDPIPFGDSVKEINGKVSSKTWRVPLRDDLEWAFAPGIDTTGFDMKLDANDFIWTYREALTKNLFRAISGGGDFVKEIAGADAYAKRANEIYGGDATPTEAQLDELDTLWAQVGLKKIDDLTLEFTTINAKGEFDAYYLLGWPPMHEQLYKKDPTKYGQDHLNIATSGEYIMTSFEANKKVQYVKNDKYPHSDETMWTGYDFLIYESAEVAFQAFLDGKLETAGVPNARISEFISDPRLLQTPDATTWRLNINGLGTVEAQKAQFPGSNYVPEPILSYTPFRHALYYILDRRDLQENWVAASGIGTTYFSDAYYVDPESGIPYRSTPQGQKVFEDFLGADWGYNKGLALSKMKEAVTAAIADGHYQKGTPQAYTEIKLDLRFMNLTQSDATKVRSDFVKTQFELLIDNSNYVKVVVDVVDTPFPGIYYDYMMTGDFDIAIGGISGSALDASSFLDVFSSDNRGGFTINWGFDSSLPEIPVTWDHDNDPLTEDITKIFSYDAIVTALNGKATIVNGDDVPPIFDEGEYTTWEDVMAEIEDFVDPYQYPEFAGEGFELIDDTIGFWIVLPETEYPDKAAVVALMEANGWTYNEEDGWPREFEKSGTYVMYSEDLLSELGQSEVVEAYGVVIPEDGDGNPLVAIYIY